MEYKASIVKIPDKIGGILNTVLKNPVITPDAIPARVAINKLVNGSNPTVIKIALTQPPSAKLPSTVRSAKSSSFYVI